MWMMLCWVFWGDWEWAPGLEMSFYYVSLLWKVVSSGVIASSGVKMAGEKYEVNLMLSPDNRRDGGMTCSQI
jgi:hypothetical protein